MAFRCVRPARPEPGQNSPQPRNATPSKTTQGFSHMLDLGTTKHDRRIGWPMAAIRQPAPTHKQKRRENHPDMVPDVHKDKRPQSFQWCRDTAVTPILKNVKIHHRLPRNRPRHAVRLQAAGGLPLPDRTNKTRHTDL